MKEDWSKFDPAPPSLEEIKTCPRYLKYLNGLSPLHIAGGFDIAYPCCKALEESMSGLLSQPRIKEKPPKLKLKLKLKDTRYNPVMK